MNRALPCIRVAIALAAIAVAACGCAAANNATSSQASAKASSRTRPCTASPAKARPPTSTPRYSVRAKHPLPQPTWPRPSLRPSSIRHVATDSPRTAERDGNAPGSGNSHDAPNRQSQTTASNRAPQPAYGQPPVAQPAPVQVAQQPAPPPPEPDVPTAYGITANGPTTDLYTAIFGPRRSGQQLSEVTFRAMSEHSMSNCGCGADIRRACRRLCLGPCGIWHRADGARHLALRGDAGRCGSAGADLLHHRPDLDDAFDLAVDRLQAGVALSGRRIGRRAARHLADCLCRSAPCSSSASASCFWCFRPRFISSATRGLEHRRQGRRHRQSDLPAACSAASPACRVLFQFCGRACAAGARMSGAASSRLSTGRS